MSGSVFVTTGGGARPGTKGDTKIENTAAVQVIAHTRSATVEKRHQQTYQHNPGEECKEGLKFDDDLVQSLDFGDHDAEASPLL